MNRPHKQCLPQKCDCLLDWIEEVNREIETIENKLKEWMEKNKVNENIKKVLEEEVK